MKKNYILILLIVLIISDMILISYYLKNLNHIRQNEVKITTNTSTITKKIEKTSITINAVGDCTIGYDDNFGYGNSFNEVLENNNYGYFFSNVLEIFANDDITIANLEGTFTEETVKKPKAFNFKAPPHYVNILKEGSIEVVNLANNHTYDYNEKGYTDTLKTLNDSNIKYFGYDNYYVYEKNNIKIGLAGIYCIEDMNCTTNIDTAINYLKGQEVNSIILSFHWGIERSYAQSSIQTYLAHYAIDNGVELVLGHHPHVLQGIELYNDKYIVYSLANFSFGGNKNPSDKDTMIFNINFNYEDENLISTNIKVYPTSVSSVNYVNDYKPTLLTDTEYDRVLKKINDKSVNINLIEKNQLN